MSKAIMAPPETEGAATTGHDCPDCEGETTNVQGIRACVGCNWHDF
jgi:hypothetical protein